MSNLLDFLQKLEDNDIYYRLNRVRDSIMVEIAVPGRRWEVEFMRDGDVQIEKFVSDGEILDESALEELFNS
ncbi:MAG: hypothetical protein IJW14_00675 [Oscillospiraceae bacterium]|nr:hypothetical protein [Oscillospiraceae bacterium]